MKSKKAFTLVEVALAIVVVAIAVLAVFALLSAGTDASAKAVGETHMAMFADGFYGGLRAKSLWAAEMEKDMPGFAGFWKDAFWKPFIYTGFPIYVPAWLYWTNAPPSTNYPLVMWSGGPYTQTFQNVSLHDKTISNIVNHAIRYKSHTVLTNFVGTNVVTALFSGVVYVWTNVYTNTVAQTTLWLWDGQYGSTNVEDGLTFYSEFDNPGNL